MVIKLERKLIADTLSNYNLKTIIFYKYNE